MAGSIELHSAFSWDCDKCGRENFHRAIEGDMSEPVMMALADDQEPVAQMVAIGAEESGRVKSNGEHEMVAPSLLYTISVAPKHVKCAACGEAYATELPILDEDYEPPEMPDDMRVDNRPPTGAGGNGLNGEVVATLAPFIATAFVIACIVIAQAVLKGQ